MVHDNTLRRLFQDLLLPDLLDESLTVHGDGSALRDWLFVEDLCRALDATMHAGNEINGQVINIGTGRDIDIKR